MSREQLKLEMVMRMNSTVVEILNNQDANESVTKKVHSFMKMINGWVKTGEVVCHRPRYDHIPAHCSINRSRQMSFLWNIKVQHPINTSSVSCPSKGQRWWRHWAGIQQQQSQKRRFPRLVGDSPISLWIIWKFSLITYCRYHCELSEQVGAWFFVATFLALVYSLNLDYDYW